MSRTINIVLWLAAVGLCSCGATQFPMDDAYHIPTKAQPTEQTLAETTAADTTVQAKQPTIVFTSVKDTTVTAVIKK